MAIDLTWPPALVFGIALAASTLLGGRYRFLSGPMIAVMVLVAVILIGYIFFAENRLQYHRAYFTAGLLVLYATLLDIYGITHLLRLLLSGGQHVHGLALLGSSVYFWSVNILTFSLWYWLIDRGGPHMRARNANQRAEFLFPEMTASDIADPRWHPGLIDYMYLAFTDATAFSPTDTLPLSTRARALMALESGLSLVMIALVTARAVNILS